MLTSLPLDFAPALAQVAEIGFTHVDVVALADRPASHLEALAHSGLIVACASLGRGLPEGCTLEAPSLDNCRTSLGLMKRQVSDAAMLGASVAYVVPPLDPAPESVTRFADGCALLADHAASRMVRLCLEPVPGRALGSAAAALEWLEATGLDRVSLLLDLGHCLISHEDPAAVVRRAGPRLAHVHLDDNDGGGDLHWPLFSGRLTRSTLQQFLTALDDVNYCGVMAFEFHPQLADPLNALREGKRIVELLAL
jgi:sugar phosphate isomerase/epimerase